MKAVRVSVNDAETVRQKLLLDGAIDKTRKLVKKDGFINSTI